MQYEDDPTASAVSQTQSEETATSDSTTSDEGDDDEHEGERQPLLGLVEVGAQGLHDPRARELPDS